MDLYRHADLLKHLCVVAGYDVEYILFDPNLIDIHQRYMIMRFMIEEMRVRNIHQDWPGINFKRQYRGIRIRKSHLLEIKYLLFKNQMHAKLERQATSFRKAG